MTLEGNRCYDDISNIIRSNNQKYAA